MNKEPRVTLLVVFSPFPTGRSIFHTTETLSSLLSHPNAGAHKGRGLGRMFLRHLGRTTALLHVVDASAADPATDYYAVGLTFRFKGWV